MPFVCSICGEESTRICARCTKDSCNNHLCDKCLRCSDCCECELSLDEHAPPTQTARSMFPKPEPSPEPPIPAPDPEPEPGPPNPDPVVSDADPVPVVADADPDPVVADADPAF